MKVAELKEELAKRGQSTQGLKAVLLERLKEALVKHLPVLTGADQSARTNDDLKGFAATARWKPLVPQEVAVPEPQNIVTTACPNCFKARCIFSSTKTQLCGSV